MKFQLPQSTQLLSGSSGRTLSWLSQIKGWYWCVILWLTLVTPAQAAMQLRVAIEQGVSQVKIGSSTKAVVRDYSTSRPLGQIAAMNAFYAQPNAAGVAIEEMHSGALWIEPSGDGYV